MLGAGGECKTAFSRCQTPNDDSGLMTLCPVTPSHYSVAILFCHSLHAVSRTNTVSNQKITRPVHDNNFLTVHCLRKYDRIVFGSVNTQLLQDTCITITNHQPIHPTDVREVILHRVYNQSNLQILGLLEETERPRKTHAMEIMQTPNTG